MPNTWIIMAVLATNLIVQSEEKLLKMLHISDLHTDILYSVHGNPKYRCHIGNSSQGEPPLNPAGNKACDPPPVLIESALKYINKTQVDPDLIIWSGDNSPHWGKSGPHFSYIYNSFKNISKLLVHYFPRAIVVPALGNHDTFPADNYPDSNNNKTEANKFYEKYIESAGFGDYLEGESRDTFKTCGYYSLPLTTLSDEVIKFIVLNTNLYYHNPLLSKDQEDPCNQIQWLKNELTSTGKKEQVFIMAHIPPGYFERNVSQQIFTTDNADTLNKKFVQLFQDKDLASKISAHFYGHTHTDALRLFVDSEKVVRGVGFNGPALSPGLYLNWAPHGINPSVRVYKYETSNRTMLDYDQHFLPLDLVKGWSQKSKRSTDRRINNAKFLREDTTDPPVPPEDSTNATEPEARNEMVAEDETTEAALKLQGEEGDDDKVLDKLVSVWKLSYKATSSFGVKDLSPKSMYIAYRSMVRMVSDEEKAVFKRYFKHNTVNLSPDGDICNSTCHQNLMCAVISFTKEQMSLCLKDDSEAITTTTKATIAPTTRKTTTTTTMTSSSIDSSQSSSTDAPVITPALERAHRFGTGEGVAVGLSIVIVLAIAIGGLFLYRRVQKNRYRSQEFLLTDSVFRYDGYSQVEDY